MIFDKVVCFLTFLYNIIAEKCDIIKMLNYAKHLTSKKLGAFFMQKGVLQDGKDDCKTTALL